MVGGWVGALVEGWVGDVCAFEISVAYIIGRAKKDRWQE